MNLVMVIANSKAVGVFVILLHFRIGLAPLRSLHILEDVDRCSRSGGAWVGRIDEWFLDYYFVVGSSS
jgi:hypothetical protein